MTQSLEAAARALLSDALSDRSLPPYLRRHLYAIKETIAIPADAEPVAIKITSHAKCPECFNGPVTYGPIVCDECGQEFDVSVGRDASPPSPDRAHVAAQGEAVARLHDDGYWTALSQDLKGPRIAGWKMDVYAAHVAAQADALAALKEMVACKDLKEKIEAAVAEIRASEFPAAQPASVREWNIDYERRKDPAWAEARRVIAATGEKHE